MNSAKGFKIISLLISAFFLAGTCVHAQSSSLKLTSPAFQDGKPIPTKFTCDSSNVSPALHRTGVPEKTQSFAILMDDPDAPMGIWVHWVLYNIPAGIAALKEKMKAAEIQALEGTNSWEEKGYNGPCPPGDTHKYIFRLFALDTVLPAKEGMTKEELSEAMKGHILGEATLTGLFRVE